MKLFKLILPFFLMTASLVKAESVVFKTNGFYYNLDTSLDEVHIKGYLIDLSFKKKPCNEKLIASLHHTLTNALKKRVLVEEDFHLMTWEKKEYKIAKSSELGKLLFNFPNIAKANKKKESFLCRGR